MDPSSPHFQFTCWLRFWISAEILSGSLLGRNPWWYYVLIQACNPTQNESDIHVRHIWCVWQTLYAMDGYMDPSSTHFQCTCWLRFWISLAKILSGSLLGRNQCYYVLIQACDPTQNESYIQVRHMSGVWQPFYAMDGCMSQSSLFSVYLSTEIFRFWPKSFVTAWPQHMVLCTDSGSRPHLEWIIHPCQTYIRCLTTFICNGWAYGSIITPFSVQVLTQILDFSQNPG